MCFLFQDAEYTHPHVAEHRTSVQTVITERQSQNGKYCVGGIFNGQESSERAFMVLLFISSPSTFLSKSFYLFFQRAKMTSCPSPAIIFIVVLPTIFIFFSFLCLSCFLPRPRILCLLFLNI